MLQFCFADERHQFRDFPLRALTPLFPLTFMKNHLVHVSTLATQTTHLRLHVLLTP